MWYFEDGGVVLCRRLCGSLNMVVVLLSRVWLLEECDVVLLRGRCGSFKRAMWYFEECDALAITKNPMAHICGSDMGFWYLKRKIVPIK